MLVNCPLLGARIENGKIFMDFCKEHYDFWLSCPRQMANEGGESSGKRPEWVSICSFTLIPSARAPLLSPRAVTRRFLQNGSALITQPRMFQRRSLHCFGLSEFSCYKKPESLEEKHLTLTFWGWWGGVRESFLEEEMSSALTLKQQQGRLGKEGQVGGEGHFLQRKRLGPSKAWRQEELGLLGQLQGLNLTGEVGVGERGEEKGHLMAVWCLRVWTLLLGSLGDEEKLGFKQKSSLMRYGYLRDLPAASFENREQ